MKGPDQLAAGSVGLEHHPQIPSYFMSSSMQAQAHRLNYHKGKLCLNITQTIRVVLVTFHSQILIQIGGGDKYQLLPNYTIQLK